MDITMKRWNTSTSIFMTLITSTRTPSRVPLETNPGHRHRHAPKAHSHAHFPDAHIGTMTGNFGFYSSHH